MIQLDRLLRSFALIAAVVARSWDTRVVRPRRLLRLPGAPLVAAVVLVGCSAGPSYTGTSGPLGDGRTAVNRQCFRMDLRQPATLGNFQLRDLGPAPVTITRITLPNAHGLRMTGAWLVPAEDLGPMVELGIGLGAFPPGGPAWAARRPLIGAVIRPQHSLFLALRMIRTRAADSYGLADGPKITYRSAGRTYTVSMRTTVALAANCDHVPYQLIPPPDQG